MILRTVRNRPPPARWAGWTGRSGSARSPTGTVVATTGAAVRQSDRIENQDDQLAVTEDGGSVDADYAGELGADVL